MYAATETCIQYPTSVITLPDPVIAPFSRFILRVSDDQGLRARGQTGVKITQNTQKSVNF